MKNIFLILSFFLLFSCQNSKTLVLAENKNAAKTNFTDATFVKVNTEQTIVSDTSFVNIRDYSSGFELDMKYATKDNFLNAKVYDCAECYLRLKTVKSLIAANEDFLKSGYHLKLFDCYRPLSVQKRMWKIVSDPQYVADPAKGSIHNRGGAVDLTIVDADGKEIDMGTPFDFFGEKASHNYQNLPEKVLENRKLLKKIMLQHNFLSFDSEWWHYNLKDASHDPVSDFRWKCE
ncbi:M15 family metallopeptidase [Flavobacterium sp. 3HN19-14]|uniref:M15 family metallopeptidase n=1 Tax=Flavobacterium sp. 3HN19-14 TaxID=3448133 RepID=UPI003EDF0ED5